MYKVFISGYYDEETGISEHFTESEYYDEFETYEEAQRNVDNLIELGSYAYIEC